MPRVVLLIVLMLPLIVLAAGPIINKHIVAQAKRKAEADAADSKTLIRHIVSLGSFAIDKYGVTFEEYDRYAQAIGSQQ